MVSELLKLAVSAHGGIGRWREVNSLMIHAAGGGTLFALKGFPTALQSDMQIAIDTRRPHCVYRPFLECVEGVWTPEQVTIRSESRVEVRDNPRHSSLNVRFGDEWDALDLLYFMGYALWNYGMTPFLFTWAGFKVGEIEPWIEGGETWRRLRVVYPDNIPSHCTEQTLYFDDSGLLRRLDYTADVLESVVAAHYCDDYREFGGIMFPTRRRAYRRLENNQPDKRVCYIKVDISAVVVR